LTQFRYRAVLQRTYFLGIMLRLELELPSGLRLRSRITKEEYAQLGLHDGKEVSFQIRTYRLLAGEDEALGPEVHAQYQAPPTIGENI
jgi:molybdopterin-binding protein